MQNLRFYLAALVFASTAVAVHTEFWQHYESADYEKAARKNIAVRSDGRLSLAPVFREVYDPSMAHLWAVAGDSRGNFYVGGGAPGLSVAKLFRIDAQGRAKLLADLDGLAIYAIAVDRRDRVFAATSPDGKVYRIDNNGRAELFYDPRAKYIWAMVFNDRGELLVGTGDGGEIHKVGADGRGAVFFRTEETHARSLALDRSGNLIVGTEPGGLILRVSPAGEGFVLHQSSKREIAAVAVSPDGRIYAAAIGTKQQQPPQQQPVPQPVIPSAPAASPVGSTSAMLTRPQPAIPPSITLSASGLGGSEVYRIEPDGEPRTVWAHAQEVVYAIAFDAGGRPLIGTGNRGRIYRLDTERQSTLLVDAQSSQITGLCRAAWGAVYAVTANIGKLFRLGPELEKEGTLESEALDAGAFSYWGRARYEGEEQGGAVALETRSGNLDRAHLNWSPWQPVALEQRQGRMASPPARFLQYRLKLTAAASGASPEVSLIELAYQNKNVAPVIHEVEDTPANFRFPAATPLSTARTLSLPPLGQRRPATPPTATLVSTPALNYAKGWIGARWRASDANQDKLSYKLEIRGEKETTWKLLAEDLKEPYHSWDSTALADGRYRVRVTASDEPDNPEGEALQASLESEPFLIDNSPPRIESLAGQIEQGKIVVRWRARDAHSVVEKAEYSLNGGPWRVVQPVGRLADSLVVDYVLRLEKPAAIEATIAVRVADEFENQAVEKVTIR